MRNLIIILIILSCSTIFAAQNDSMILMLPSDARALGMAEAYSSAADSSSALYYNPAGLGNIKSISANYSYMNYLFGQQYHNITGAYRVEGLGVFGLGFCLLSDEGFKLTSDTGETETLIDTSSWYINAGFGYELSSVVFIGINLKYISEGYYIGSESITSSGMSFGLGVLVKNLIMDDLDLSCVIKNIGFKSAYENGTKGGVPLELVLGGKYEFSEKLFLTSDIALNNYNRTGLRIGGESAFLKLSSDFRAFFRLGLQLPAPVEDHFSSGIFSGIGINWKNYGLDYAFNYTGLETGIIHYVTLKVDIGTRAIKTEVLKTAPEEDLPILNKKEEIEEDEITEKKKKEELPVLKEKEIIQTNQIFIPEDVPEESGVINFTNQPDAVGDQSTNTP